MLKRCRCWLSILLACLLSTAAWGSEHSEYVEGQALVVLRGGVSRVTAADVSHGGARNRLNYVAASTQARVLSTYPALSEASGREVFALVASDRKTTEELVRELEKDPNVLAASPNYRVYPLKSPNDPQYADGSLWGIEKIRVAEVWDKATGSPDVYTAVIDTGIAKEHEDLKDRVSLQYSRNCCGEAETYIDDKKGHGSHVAGTIAATGNNGKGVVGVNWNGGIIALKVFPDRGKGAADSDIAKALDYLTKLLLKDPSLKVPAVNLSLGGYEPNRPDKYMGTPMGLAYKALDKLDRTVIVVAAGNEGLEVGRPAPFTDYARSVVQGRYVYPASYIGIDNLVVVGAMQSNDQGASFSNWSDTNVDITAPGAGILSSIPREAPDENGLPYNKDYDRWNGTSMAAPHVAGAISLLASIFPDKKASELKAAILEGANREINPVAKPDPEGPNHVGLNALGQKLSVWGMLDVKGAYDRLRTGSLNAPHPIEVPRASWSISVGEEPGRAGYRKVILTASFDLAPLKGKVPSAPEVFCNNQLENIRAVLNVASGTGEVRIEGVLSKDLLDYTVLRRLTYEADGHRYAAKLQGAPMLFRRIKGYTVIPPTPVALKKESWRVYINEDTDGDTCRVWVEAPFNTGWRSPSSPDVEVVDVPGVELITAAYFDYAQDGSGWRLIWRGRIPTARLKAFGIASIRYKVREWNDVIEATLSPSPMMIKDMRGFKDPSDPTPPNPNPNPNPGPNPGPNPNPGPSPRPQDPAPDKPKDPSPGKPSPEKPRPDEPENPDDNSVPRDPEQWGITVGEPDAAGNVPVKLETRISLPKPLVAGSLKADATGFVPGTITVEAVREKGTMAFAEDPEADPLERTASNQDLSYGLRIAGKVAKGQWDTASIRSIRCRLEGVEGERTIGLGERGVLLKSMKKQEPEVKPEERKTSGSGGCDAGFGGLLLLSAAALFLRGRCR